MDEYDGVCPRCESEDVLLTRPSVLLVLHCLDCGWVSHADDDDEDEDDWR